MIKAIEWVEFLNEWGYPEKYDSKSIEVEKTGHMNRGSAYSSSDSCSNCDGARCDYCHDIYCVTICDRPTYNAELGYRVQNVRIKRYFQDWDDALKFYNEN